MDILLLRELSPHSPPKDYSPCALAPVNPVYRAPSVNDEQRDPGFLILPAGTYTSTLKGPGHYIIGSIIDIKA